MRTCFFGDIHGNEYALEACLEFLDTLNPHEVICLGDLVGWLPFGDRTLKRMAALSLPTVAGNHDLLVAGSFADRPEQLDRMQATAFNAGLLSTVEGAFDYLLSLPLMIERPQWVAVHHSPFSLPESGAPVSIQSFDYLDETTLADSLSAWRAYPQRLIFSGHDHVPAVYELPDSVTFPRLEDVKVYRPGPAGVLTVQVEAHSRYWIKAGSVGGPYRDHVPMANPVLYDRESQTISLFRVPFPRDLLRRELESHRFARNLPTLRRYVELLE